MNIWGTVAEWFVAAATLILASVAVFQEKIRGWFYRPELQVSIRTEPPDCVAVDLTTPDGSFITKSVYLRLWIQNFGNATARNVEVYAQELRRQRADGTWESVRAFPPMNLKWANFGTIYFPFIVRKMGKHCDIGHIVDPARREQLGSEDAPRLGLTPQQASLDIRPDGCSKPQRPHHWSRRVPP